MVRMNHEDINEDRLPEHVRNIYRELHGDHQNKGLIFKANETETRLAIVEFTSNQTTSTVRWLVRSIGMLIISIVAWGIAKKVNGAP